MGQKKSSPLGLKIEVSFNNAEILNDQKVLTIVTKEEATDSEVTIKGFSYDVNNVIDETNDAEFTATIIQMAIERLSILRDEIAQNNQSEVH
ncbi:hypothetical protein [Thorsellia kenyensis]|uniref:Uncharacterized protein n=1 Tax=Thorsellia kenyensis TaxID=1549888 RepID=A0ABV6C6I5_9GAMM